MIGIFLVTYSVRKGLGPDWIKKTMEIGIDDIEPGTTEKEMLEMAKLEFKDEMSRSGLSKSEYEIEEIEGI